MQASGFTAPGDQGEITGDLALIDITSEMIRDTVNTG